MNVVKIIATLPGRKIWADSTVRIEATPFNIRSLKGCGFSFDWQDTTGQIAALRELEGLASQHVVVDYPDINYEPKMKLRAHQRSALALSHDREAFAYLLEMGLGKTAILIHNAAMLHTRGKVTGVLVLAPRGVHRQWIEEQIPQHIDPRIKWNSILWNRKPIKPAQMNKPGLTFLSMNSDAIRTQKGFEQAKAFLQLHSDKSYMVADESQLFKGWSSTRTQSLLVLGQIAKYRRISTGTPIANNVVDVFSQFQFLDQRILGHKYITSFKRQYCVFGGWQNRSIVAHKNLEELYTLIAPHCFRLTKAEATDLPAKNYVSRSYEMSDKTKIHYTALKKTYMTFLDGGQIVDAKNGAVCMMRLQQVLCGHLPDEEGRIQKIDNDRILALQQIVEQVSGPIVIWARFIEDARNLAAAFSNQVALYRGTDKDREAAKRDYLSGKKRFFVANPASGGTGLDGLQKITENVIYYSNDFNALHRWQSEDRTHRMGMTGSVTYFDLVADRTIDRRILQVLQAKKSISDLTLDEIRQAIAAS